MSVQYAAMASQKFTWPCFTAVVPASTEAVSVTRLPAFTEVTTTPLEVTASEVVVVVRANAEELIAAVHTISSKTHHMRVDYSMFEGFEVRGNARTVISRGEVIVDGGEFLGKRGRGNYLRRQARGGAWQ